MTIVKILFNIHQDFFVGLFPLPPPPPPPPFPPTRHLVIDLNIIAALKL